MRKIFSIISLLLLSACVFRPDPEGFVEKEIQTEYFSFAVWEKESIQSGKPLRLYIEGDGDPNPRYQIAKYYASTDEAPNVIYIARPCQWIEEKICKNPSIYGENRFSTEVIGQIQILVQHLIKKYKAPTVELVGYDGGAVIAFALATKLPVSRIITIAGIIDPVTYANYHGLKPFAEYEMFKTMEHLSTLESIPQVHYVGSKDEITPRRLVERFVAKMNNPTAAVVKVVPGVDHTNWEGVQLDY